MLGGKQKHSRGYTIVEVMIVLAVSGIMFVIAAQFVQGKQEKSSFTSGVNSMASSLQDVIEQVADGKFSDIQINCITSRGGPVFPSGSAAQGSHFDCVYLGKILHFYGNNNPSAYETFTIAGNRLVQPGNSQLVTQLPGPNPLAEAVPTPVSPPKIAPTSDLTTQATTPQKLNATVYQGTAGASGSQIYAFGFLQGLGASNGAAGGVSGGAQTVSLYYANTLMTPNAAESVAASTMTDNLRPIASVSVCLTDGTQYAKLVIGSNANQLSVDTIWEGHVTTCS